MIVDSPICVPSSSTSKELFRADTACGMLRATSGVKSADEHRLKGRVELVQRDLCFLRIRGHRVVIKLHRAP